MALVLALTACAPAEEPPPPATAPAQEEAAPEEAPAEEAAAPASDFVPSNVECIAPANPGGGWDWTYRSAGKVLSDIGLVEGTVKVTNMAGGGGGVAFANVVTQNNDNDNLIVAASPATTLRLAQGQYGEFTEMEKVSEEFEEVD